MAEQKQRSLIGACVLAAGSPTAGIVLFRINAWTPTREFNGRMWVARAHAELCEETGLSMKQVKTAVAALRNRGLIMTSQHLFHGKNVMHVMITGAGKSAIDTHRVLAPEWHGQVDPAGTSHDGPEGSVPIQSIELEKELEKELEASHAADAVPAEGDMGKISGKGKTAAELIALATAQPKVTEKTESIQRLGQYWCEAVASAYGTYVPPLTTKQIGQLKGFVAKLPKGKAQDAMLWVTHNWVDFVKAVEEQAGVKGTPSSPQIGFLLLHAGIALELAGKTKVPTPKQEAPKNPMPAPVVVAEEKPATLAELLAIMNEDDGDD